MANKTDYVMWKEIRNIEEDKIGAFVSELLCHYIQGVSEIVGTNFKIELLTSKQRKSQYIRNPKRYTIFDD